MTPQSTFMIVATVSVGQLKKLRDLLGAMNKIPGHADPENALIPFCKFDQLHFARFVIIEANTAHEIREFGVNPRPWRPALAFLGDVDGDMHAFLADLVNNAEPGLKAIFSHCEDFSEENLDMLQWLQAHDIRPNANYVNWLGRTVKQIREEVILHQTLSRYLQEIAHDVDWEDIRTVRQKLLSHVEMEKHKGRLTLSLPEPTPREWKIRNLFHLLGVPLILLILSPLLLIALPFFALRLRMLERSDPELFIRPNYEHVKVPSAQEDWGVSNQYSVFGDVKPGLFRLLTFKFILILTNYFARHVYNRGFLARIKTIHFARWVFMDNNHRVFFASNYDGSHESYMDDFINKVGWGLNLTFSNAVGYPTTTWMIKEGAQREHAFKYTQRRHQIPTEVWYKAYPGLTAVDLARNSRIRQGIEIRQENDAEIREWLRLI